ncbi:MAG: hypothetical protein Kow0042_15120 [Calditrichia bacterium]
MDDFERKEWYLWPCRAYPGAFNMSVDHRLARTYGILLDKPLLRFFTWDPYCISLGFHQNPEDVDRELCEQEGIDLVRRPTGGRAILHAEELTYSVVYPFGNLDVSGFYRLIHLPFVKALQNWGIPAEFQPSQADFRKFYRTENSALCFATSAKYEVEIEGRKLIGSAQRVYEHSILQHGSVLLGDYHQKLIDFLKLSPDIRKKVQTYMENHTIHIWRYKLELTAEKLAELVTQQFSELFGIRFQLIYDNKDLVDALEKNLETGQFQIMTEISH